MNLPFGLALPFYLSPRLADPIVWICVVLGAITFAGVGRSVRDILALTVARRKAAHAAAGATENPARTPTPTPVAAAPNAAMAAIRLQQTQSRPIEARAPAAPKDDNPMRGYKTWCAHCKTPEHNALTCPRVRTAPAAPKPVRQKEEEYAV